MRENEERKGRGDKTRKASRRKRRRREGDGGDEGRLTESRQPRGCGRRAERRSDAFGGREEARKEKVAVEIMPGGSEGRDADVLLEGGGG